MKIERIQAAGSGRLQQLVQLEEEAFGQGGLNEWHLVPFVRHGCVFVASKEGVEIGMAQYMRDWESPDRAYLVGVSIAAAWRGRGLGTILLRNSMQDLKSMNISEVELTVDPKNEVAIRVYKGKLGFVTKEIRQDEYGIGEDRLIMTVDLAHLV